LYGASFVKRGILLLSIFASVFLNRLDRLSIILRRQRSRSSPARAAGIAVALIDEHAAGHLFMIHWRTQTKRSEEKLAVRRGLTASNTCIQWIDVTRTMMQ
jgi:hypothetical protein